MLAESVGKLLGSLEGFAEGALEATAASSFLLVVGGLVVVVVAVVEAVGLAVATLLVFDCEDALPTAIITNKINFITLNLSCKQARQIGPHLFCCLDNIFRQRRRAECVCRMCATLCGGAMEVGNVITRITR